MTANIPAPADADAAMAQAEMAMKMLCPMHQQMVTAPAMAGMHCDGMSCVIVQSMT